MPFFELKNPYTLEINLRDNFAWTKPGSMVAYQGDIRFEADDNLDRNMNTLLSKAVSGDSVEFTKANGSGNVYLADYSKKILVLKLENESIVVNNKDVMAFEPTVSFSVHHVKMAGVNTGKMTGVQLTGTGYIAISTHSDPLVLSVAPDKPVFTDPTATVAWSGNLTPQAHLDHTKSTRTPRLCPFCGNLTRRAPVDASLRSLVDNSGSEFYQLKFEGDSGYVMIQPFEEHCVTVKNTTAAPTA
jgi:uncharacterized protein (AIM24 family)